MKRIPWSLCRTLSVLVTLALVVGMVWIAPLAAGAATVDNGEKSYDIAVVFDNSGSMYYGKAWCRAKYAMEIFASMLNYDKDMLHIFPMWSVMTDGSKPASGGSFEAIDIKTKADIDKISNMYTVAPSGTPFEPITDAYDYLSRSTADEKWIIVLTDGEFNQIKRTDAFVNLSENDLKNRLLEVAKNGIKVQYLGFADAKALSSEESRNFYAKKSSDTSLKKDLIDICNAIFQRSELPKNRLNNAALNLDLSMKSVIVFAQGSNAQITSLTNSNGQKVAVMLDSGQRKYSEIKAGGHEDAEVDTSLAGQVVTFAACPKGEYTLTYSGVDNDNIQIFYEPDVDIKVTLKNSDGEEITESDTLTAGTYTISGYLVDSVTGEDVTTHELMGNDVTLNIYVKTSPNSPETEYANGDKIEFEPGDEVSIIVRGRYLEHYTISSEDDPDLKWLTGIDFQPPAIPLQVDAEVLQDNAWYVQSDHDNWQPIRVDLTIEGQPLTDEQLANTQLVADFSREINYRIEPVPGESAYLIYVGQDSNGQYVEPDRGDYSLTVKATYTDEYGKNSTNEDEVSFGIHLLSKSLITLLVILGLLAFLLAVAAWCIHPVLPKKLYLYDNDTRQIAEIDVKGDIVIKADRELGASVTPLAGKAKMIPDLKNRWTRHCTSDKQTFKLVKPYSRGVTDLKIDEELYYCRGNTLYKGDYDNGEIVEFLVIESGTSVSWYKADGHPYELNGTLYINKVPDNE